MRLLKIEQKLHYTYTNVVVYQESRPEQRPRDGATPHLQPSSHMA